MNRIKGRLNLEKHGLFRICGDQQFFRGADLSERLQGVMCLRRYNTPKLTKGQRRQKKIFLVRRAKEKREKMNDIALQRSGKGMQEYYAKANQHFRAFLEETEHDTAALHENVSNFAEVIYAANKLDESWIDVSSMTDSKIEERVFLSDNGSGVGAMIDDWTTEQGSLLSGAEQYEEQDELQGALIPAASVVNVSSSLKEPASLTKMVRLLSKMELSLGSESSVASFLEVLEQISEAFTENEFDNEEKTEWLNDVLKKLSFQAKHALYNARQNTEKMLLIIRYFATFEEHSRVTKDVIKASGIKKRNHKGLLTPHAVFPTGESVAHLLNSCTHHKAYTEGMGLYHKMLNEYNFTRNIDTYIALIRLCAKSNQTEKAIKLLYDALDLTSDTAEAYRLQMSEAAVSEIHRHEIIRFHRNQLELFTEALRACSRSVHYSEEVDKIFSLMMNLKLKPDRRVVSLLLSSCARSADVNKAKYIWDLLIEEPVDGETSVEDQIPRVKPDIILYNSMLYVFARSQWNANRKKESLFRDYDPTKTIDRLLDSKPAPEVLNHDQVKAFTTYVMPNEDEKNTMFGGQLYDVVVPKVYRSEYETDELEKLFQLEDSHGSKKPSETGYQDVLLQDLYKSGHNVSRGKMAIFALEGREVLAERNITQALSLFSDLQAKGLHPDTATVNTLLRLFIYAARQEKAEDVYSNWFQKYALSKDDRTYNAMMDLYKERQEFTEAERIFQEGFADMDGLQGFSTDTIGNMVEIYMRSHDKDLIDKGFELIAAYKALEEKGRGPFGRDLFEKHYQVVRMVCKETGTEIPEGLVPPDPNAWKSMTIVKKALKAVKSDKRMAKAARFLETEAQKL